MVVKEDGQLNKINDLFVIVHCLEMATLGGVAQNQGIHGQCVLEVF